MYTRILLSILLMLPMLANAEEVEIDGLWYNLSPKEKTAEGIQYKDTRYAGDVIIPATVTYLDCNLLNAVNITDLGAWNRILFFDWSSNPLAYARHLYLNGEEVKGKVKSE